MDDLARLKRCFVAVAVFAGLLWAIRLAETLFGWELSGLGVAPREVQGLIGLLFAPLVHGSFGHLFANTLPLLILGTALLYGYPRSRWWVIAIVWLGSGLGVWLTGRPSIHIGASGLAHGLMFFIFIAGIFRRDLRSIALAMLAFFLYGGMVWTIFPREPGISFESHFWGAVAGAACAILFRNRDPKPPRKRYDWEDEAEDEDWRTPFDPRL